MKRRPYRRICTLCGARSTPRPRPRKRPTRPYLCPKDRQALALVLPDYDVANWDDVVRYGD